MLAESKKHLVTTQWGAAELRRKIPRIGKERIPGEWGEEDADEAMEFAARTEKEYHELEEKTRGDNKARVLEANSLTTTPPLPLCTVLSFFELGPDGQPDYLKFSPPENFWKLPIPEHVHRVLIQVEKQSMERTKEVLKRMGSWLFWGYSDQLLIRNSSSNMRARTMRWRIFQQEQALRKYEMALSTILAVDMSVCVL